MPPEIWYHLLGYILSAYMLYSMIFSIKYLRVEQPSLILNAEGIQYRVIPSTAVYFPWSNIKQVTIETSTALHGQPLTTRYLSIYPREYEHHSQG